MARTRKTNQEEVQTDVLTKTHEQFKHELDDRITIGEKLLSQEIKSESDLKTSEEAFEAWDNYNLELFKQSFTRPNNDYHAEYKYESWVPFGAPTTPYEMMIEHKKDIERQIKRLKTIRDKIDLIETNSTQQAVAIPRKDPKKLAIDKLINLFSKFHRIAQTLRLRHGSRDTLIIKDEYDVQDLLRTLLKEHFDDVRDEDYVPSYAGSNSRVDFVLKNEKVVIEVKMTNDKLKDKLVGEQLVVDIARYKNHPDCELLILFVYDKGDHILNKPGLIKDLNNMSTSEIKVLTFINPM